MDNNKNIFKDILFVFPVMFYYALEALIVGIFISFVWKFILSGYFGDIGYFQIVAFYWIFKMLMFDVFKLIAGLTSMGSNMQREMENDEDNSEYNENITP